MAGYTQINLADLPPPDVIEVLDFEAILTGMRDDLVARFPAIVGVIDLESEPARKLLEVFAYRELMLRARINSAARGVMLAYAAGADLENLGALLGVSRLLITPANPDAVPPVAAVFEGDEDLRRRIQLSLEGFSTAGPSGAYIFHALSAHPDVKDASAASPSPGDVLVAVLSRVGNGTAAAPVLAAVSAALNDDQVRPLCDSVTVVTATIISYAITATIFVDEGPDSATIVAASLAAAQAYAAAQHRLGRDITISGIHAALHGPGVTRVDLTLPAANISVGSTQAAFCTGITLTNGGVLT
jgi:phage-related baseplate assembly protein